MSENTSVSIPVWKTEFDRRVTAFATAVKMYEKDVRDVLAELGADGSSEMSLTLLDNEEFLPFGDLRAAFVEKRSFLKIGILRAGISHLRGSSYQEKTHATTGDNGVVGAVKELIASNRPKEDWTDDELLKMYDDTTPEIATILGKRSHARPCIVFKNDGSVNVEISAKLLKIAKKQPTADRHRLDDGQFVRVYRPGEFIARPLEESPFYAGSTLVDGYCSQSDTNWTGVPHEIRVLVRLHVTKVETTKLSKREMQRICKEAHGDSATFRKDYSEAVVVYNELETQDKLPKLKILPGEVRNQPVKQDHPW